MIKYKYNGLSDVTKGCVSTSSDVSVVALPQMIVVLVPIMLVIVSAEPFHR